MLRQQSSYTHATLERSKWISSAKGRSLCPVLRSCPVKYLIWVGRRSLLISFGENKQFGQSHVQ